MIKTFSHLALRHGLGILATALCVGAFVSQANAASNLIQNSGFDSAPPANFGNNIGHSIAPWIVGTGDQPNVVKVDGPGGYDYGSSGPESDASAPGAGKNQYYLDITNGQNDFYQSFTVPACQAAPAGTTATVTFGGYFSGRDNDGGTATIKLRQGAGLNGAVIQTLTAVVAPGNSRTDPWIHVQGTATLVFGQTFSYVVAMPNPMNFDNAHLTIDSDPCNPPPPPPPPPPSSTGCLSVTPDVKCGPNGTITVTLNGSNFTSDQISLAAQTGGVTVSPPQQPWAPNTTWTISGATPGQTLTLIANATKVGGGSEAGTDQCCSAEITITVPDCPPPAPPFDIGIAKMGEVNMANPGGAYNFTIGVRNLAGPINTSMPLTFTDVVPAGMTFTSVTPTNYTCLPAAPVSAGTTLTCTYNGPFPITTGQVIGSVAIVADGGNGPYTNCASLGQTDGDSSNDKACATVRKDFGNLTVVKEVENNTQPKVSTTGLVYPVTVTCGSNVTSLSLIDGMPQTVGPIPYNTSCSVDEGTPPMPSGACPAGQLTWTKSKIPEGNVQIVSGINTTVRVHNKLDCVQSGGGGNGSLVVTKTVINKVMGVPFPTGLTYPVTVTCGSMVTPLTLSENVPQTVSNIPTPASCHVEEGTMPTVNLPCAMMGQVPTWSTAYLPTQDVNVTGPNTPVTVQNTIECKPPGSNGFKLTVNKVVTNRTNPQIPITGTVFPISASCMSGMSPAVVTPMPLADGGSQIISGLANGTTCNITETLPPPPPTIAVSCLPNYSPVWSTTPVPAVTINNGDATATVQNFLDCVADVGGEKGYLLVNKFIDNQTNDRSGPFNAALNALVFPITVTCNGNDTLLNISPPTPQAVHAVPVGQLCNVTEGTRPSPPTSSSACSNGQVPTWGAIDYSATPAGLPTPVTSGQGPAIHVKNTLICAQGMPPVCKTPMIPGNVPGQCVCPPGMVQTGGGCMVVPPPPPRCYPPMVAGALPGQCVCPQGMVQTGGGCMVVPPPPPRCYPPMVAGALPGQCVCPAGTVPLNGSCTTSPPPPPACKPPMIPGATKGQCVCPPGTKQQGGSCAETIVCRSPAKLNSRGTACTCPDGMTLKGNSCVKEERKRPAVSTDDIIRIVPGLIGPGGFGGSGGDRSGSDKGGGGGYKPPGVR